MFSCCWINFSGRLPPQARLIQSSRGRSFWRSGVGYMFMHFAHLVFFGYRSVDEGCMRIVHRVYRVIVRSGPGFRFSSIRFPRLVLRRSNIWSVASLSLGVIATVIVLGNLTMQFDFVIRRCAAITFLISLPVCFDSGRWDAVHSVDRICIWRNVRRRKQSQRSGRHGSRPVRIICSYW